MLFDAHFFGNSPLIYIFNHPMYSSPMYFNANKEGLRSCLFHVIEYIGIMIFLFLKMVKREETIVSLEN